MAQSRCPHSRPCEWPCRHPQRATSRTLRCKWPAGNDRTFRSSGGNLGELLELAASRSAVAGLSSHHHQRQSRPGQDTVDPPPLPHGFVEDLESHLVDTTAAQQPAMNPPGWGSDFVQAVNLLHFEPGAGEHFLQRLAVKTTLVAHGTV